jgi:hypothetical protein
MNLDMPTSGRCIGVSAIAFLLFEALLPQTLDRKLKQTVRSVCIGC